MSDKDPIKDLFRDKLQSHEVMPSESVWSGVSDALGHSAASSASVGSASFLKVAAIAVGVSAVGVVGFMMMNSDETEPLKSIEKTVLQEKDIDESVSSETIDSDVEESKSPEITLSDSESLSSEKVISNESIRDTQPELITINDSLPVSTPSESQANPVVVEEKEIHNINEANPVSPEVPVIVPAVTINEDQGNEGQVSSETTSETIETPELEETYEEIVSDQDESSDILIEESIVLPNIFTPNGDRVNDLFEIEIGDKLEFQIVVLNRQNQLVFKSGDPRFQWDGTMLNGEPAPEGVYLYYFSAKDRFGNDITESSVLTIKR